MRTYRCRYCKKKECPTEIFIMEYMVTRRWKEVDPQFVEGDNEDDQEKVKKTIRNYLYIKFLEVTGHAQVVYNRRIDLPKCIVVVMNKEYPIVVGNESANDENSGEEDTPNCYWTRYGTGWGLKDPAHGVDSANILGDEMIETEEVKYDRKELEEENLHVLALIAKERMYEIVAEEQMWDEETEDAKPHIINV